MRANKAAPSAIACALILGITSLANATQPEPTVTDKGGGNVSVEYHDAIDVGGEPPDPPGNWGGGHDRPDASAGAGLQPPGVPTANVTVNGVSYPIQQATLADLREIEWFDRQNTIIGRLGMFFASMLIGIGVLDGVPDSWQSVPVDLVSPTPGAEELVLVVRATGAVETHLRNERLRALMEAQRRALGRRDRIGARLFETLRDMLHRPENYRRPNSTEFDFRPPSYLPPLPGDEIRMFPAMPGPVSQCDQDRLRQLLTGLASVGGSTTRLIWETEAFYVAPSTLSDPTFIFLSLRDYHLLNAALIMVPDDQRGSYANAIRNQLGPDCTADFWRILLYSAETWGRSLPYELSWAEPYL